MNRMWKQNMLLVVGEWNFIVGKEENNVRLYGLGNENEAEQFSF